MVGIPLRGSGVAAKPVDEVLFRRERGPWPAGDDAVEVAPGVHRTASEHRCREPGPWKCIFSYMPLGGLAQLPPESLMSLRCGPRSPAGRGSERRFPHRFHPLACR